MHKVMKRYSPFVVSINCFTTPEINRRMVKRLWKLS